MSSLAIVAGALATLALAQPAPPRVLDERLELQLVAAEPDIRTPVGLAIDAQGRVLVVESHTHFRPNGYEGPPADRILIFDDFADDGRARRIRTFYEGSVHTMNIAVEADGGVLVATRQEVFRLRDADGDGRADGPPERLAWLETKGNYPHNGLSGFAVDPAGGIFFGFGENLGEPYVLHGVGGDQLPGGGEGGNVYWMRPDGSQLRRVATGFWNPFHLALDSFGRLLAVDNDPDSRPPCRLIHVVEGGDYGYRFRNGRKGLHPFTAWNGELPGTLPMAAGTGEAPSGILFYAPDHLPFEAARQLPAEYRGDWLVTSWGDHRIERYRLTPRGASVAATMTAVVQGGDQFRPVGIATAPDGSVFISDWVDKSYQLHGKGRLWRLAAKPSDAGNAPPTPVSARHGLTIRNWGRDAAATPPQDLPRKLEFLAGPVAADPLAASVVARLPAETAAGREGLLRALKNSAPDVRAAALRRLTKPIDLPRLLAVLDDPDPFLQQAARHALTTGRLVDGDFDWSQAATADQRLGAALALREIQAEKVHPHVAAWLDDADVRLRLLAAQWIADDGLQQHKPAVERALASAASQPLFETYVAALLRLDGRRHEFAGEQYVAERMTDPNIRPDLLRMCLTVLRPDHPALTAELFDRALSSDDTGLRLEAIRSLRESPLAERPTRLLTLARDKARPADERAEAVVGIDGAEVAQRKALLALAVDAEEAVAVEALRSLRGAPLTDDERQTLLQAASARRGASSAWRSAYARAIDPQVSDERPPPTDLDAWEKLLAGGDAAAGRRVFFHPKLAACGKCHQLDGRGGRVGPDLSTATAMPRRRVVSSILTPSAEVAPQFAAWQVVTHDGRQFTGVLLSHDNDGVRRYADPQGKIVAVKQVDIEHELLSPESLMPADVHRQLTLDELRDLAALLSSGGQP